jgi:ABC-2 type transport system ATP-binding protein
VAAALVHCPPVLFLDEPTTGLDPQSRSDLWDMIRELVAEGTTVLLTTQYLEEADRLAHRIAVVDGGRVIAEGTPTELKAQLGATVAEISFRSETAARRATSALRALEGLDPRREGTLIRFSSDDGARALTGALRALDDKRIYPTGIALRQPSLDDVFLTLTGHHAEPAEAPQPPAPRAKARGAA